MATGGQYQVYISRWEPATQSAAAGWGTWKELEDTYPGLKYKSCEGLETQGEPKFYTEDYAETSQPRAFLTDKVKENDITLELLFMDVPAQGQTAAVSRFSTYSSFLSFITGRRFKFYDSERKIVRDMFLSGEAELSESKFYGGRKYFIAAFPCTSLNTPDLTGPTSDNS